MRLNLSFTIFCVVATALTVRFAVKMYRLNRARKMVARLAGIDNSWDPAKLMATAERLHDTVRAAIMAGKLEQIKENISDGLYARLKGKKASQFGFTGEEGHYEILSTSMKPVDVEDFNDDSKDRFSVYVTHSHILVGYSTATAAKEGRLESELWTFARKGDGWIVDDIKPFAGTMDIINSRLSSEALDIIDNQAKLEAAERKSEAQVERPEEHEINSRSYSEALDIIDNQAKPAAAEKKSEAQVEKPEEHEVFARHKKYKTGRRDYH